MTPPDDNKATLTVAQVARRWNLNVRTVQRACRDGLIGFRLGGRGPYRIPLAHVEALEAIKPALKAAIEEQKIVDFASTS